MAAEAFAEEVSAFLQDDPPDEWYRIVQDFKIIEIGVLIRRLVKDHDLLHYLLSEYILEILKVPYAVPGVWLQEQRRGKIF